MKVIVIGGGGTIGGPVADALSARHGSKGMPAAHVAAAYVESVEGQRNGETLDARAFGAS